jgi:hypothetical protein
LIFIFNLTANLLKNLIPISSKGWILTFLSLLFDENADFTFFIAHFVLPLLFVLAIVPE